MALIIESIKNIFKQQCGGFLSVISGDSDLLSSVELANNTPQIAQLPSKKNLTVLGRANVGL